MDKAIISTKNKIAHNFQKVGIDTSVLVNLIVKEIDLFKFKEKEFSPNDSLYYAMRTKYEFKGVLLNKFGFNKKEKNKLWKRAKNSLKLNPIRIGGRDISRHLEKVRKANASLIKQINPQFKMFNKIGEEDIQIIANFLKWKINKVYTSDRAFYETCKILGLKSRLISISEYFQLKKK